MAYVFEKHIVETFEVTSVRKQFMLFDVFSRVRKDIRHCEFCETAFLQEDNTNLAWVKGKKNHLICDSCAEKAIQGGATVI